MDHLSSSEAENVSSSGVAGGGSSTSARYKLMSPAKLPISRFSTLSIPPGLSPTSFLESPVLLSNYKLEQSPTTGSFQMMPGTVGSTTLSNTNCSNNNYFDDGKSSCFEFKPCTVLQSGLGLSSPETVFCAGLNHQKSEPSDQVQGQFQPHSFPSPTLNCEATAPHNDLSLSTPMNMVSSGANTPAEVDSNDLNQRGPPALQSDERSLGPPVLAEKSSEDGYNWRKYGQKHVRGSEFPRSYYKCTHPNCEVKKLFERSHDGQITEIIYKGTHDHPKPQSGRRLAAGSAVTTQDERLQVSLFPDRDATDDNPEGAVSQSNAILDEVDDDDDPLTKRRKMDIGSVDVNQDYQVVKPIREPRVVVQTLSEVDILDDGYRWRKYGQKVVRGNPNPRSYYKCTNSGCPVRKHVERAAHDPKAVITTYEGKHNHDVPTARISTHDAAGSISSNGILRVRSEESNKVSLDLGVGINSSSAENGLDGQAPLHGRHSHGQMQLGTSNIKVIGEPSVSTAYYGAFNGGGPDQFESVDPRSHHSFGTLSLSHSSNMYPQSMGRVLLGP